MTPLTENIFKYDIIFLQVRKTLASVLDHTTSFSVTPGYGRAEFLLKIMSPKNSHNLKQILKEI